MPIYEYRCNKCDKCFEQLVFPSDDPHSLECPSCGEKDVSRLVSAFSCASSESGNRIGGSLSTGCSPSGGFS